MVGRRLGGGGGGRALTLTLTRALHWCGSRYASPQLQSKIAVQIVKTVIVACRLLFPRAVLLKALQDWLPFALQVLLILIGRAGHKKQRLLLAKMSSKVR